MVSSALENQFITPNNMVIFSCTMISWRKRLLYIDWNNWARLPPPSGCASLGLGQECSKSRNKDVDTKDVVCLPFISHHFLRRMNMCFISCLLVGSFFFKVKIFTNCVGHESPNGLQPYLGAEFCWIQKEKIHCLESIPR